MDQKILNRKHLRYVDEKTMIYIGRPTSAENSQKHFGNPFSQIWVSRAAVHVKSREEAIANFEKWIKGEDFHDIEPKRRKWILDHLDLLRGKDLVCWCSPEKCHGDIYLSLLKEGDNGRKRKKST